MTDATIVGGLFVVVGCALLVGVAWLYLQAQASLSWVSTSGEVVSAERDTDGRPAANSSRIIVTYSYRVGQRTFQGHRVTFGDVIWNWQSRSNTASSRS